MALPAGCQTAPTRMDTASCPADPYCAVTVSLLPASQANREWQEGRDGLSPLHPLPGLAQR